MNPAVGLIFFFVGALGLCALFGWTALKIGLTLFCAFLVFAGALIMAEGRE